MENKALKTGADDANVWIPGLRQVPHPGMTKMESIDDNLG
jgi:hypothetical protein